MVDTQNHSLALVRVGISSLDQRRELLQFLLLRAVILDLRYRLDCSVLHEQCQPGR
ncbi:hypothetical protein DA89_2595 [Vibrio paracholerae]|nr:hypothetical protein DA89_2595 [Vibrio paracholerae]